MAMIIMFPIFGDLMGLSDTKSAGRVRKLDIEKTVRLWIEKSAIWLFLVLLGNQRKRWLHRSEICLHTIPIPLTGMPFLSLTASAYQAEYHLTILLHRLNHWR